MSDTPSVARASMHRNDVAASLNFHEQKSNPSSTVEAALRKRQEARDKQIVAEVRRGSLSSLLMSGFCSRSLGLVKVAALDGARPKSRETLIRPGQLASSALSAVLVDFRGLKVAA